MSTSETITRTDLTNILNEVLPFSFTDFRHHSGTVSVPNSTLTQVHSETFASGSWLILTTLTVNSGGSGTANIGQNRIVNPATDLIYSHKDMADTSIVNPNFYVLENANNTTIRLDSYQISGNTQSQAWTYTAIRIGDKFAQAETQQLFTATRNSSATDGTFTGVYDPLSGIVTFTASIRFSSNIGTNTTLYTIPEKYRPKSNVTVPALVYTDSNTPVAYAGTIYTSGVVTQNATGSGRQIFISGSYSVK